MSRLPGGASLGLSALADRLQRGVTPWLGGGLLAFNSCHHKPCPRSEWQKAPWEGGVVAHRPSHLSPQPW